MIKAYQIINHNLVEMPKDKLATDLSHVVWVDLYYPTKDEEDLLEKLMNINIPTREEMHEIELSSRLYQRNHTLYSTINIVTKSDTTQPESHSVTFVLHDRCLITVRYIEELSYENLQKTGKLDSTYLNKGNHLLSIFLDNITEQLADILENISHNMEATSHEIFKYSYKATGTSKTMPPNFKHIITQVGSNEDLLSKARESLFTLTRMLGFILQSSYYHEPEDKKQLTLVMRDVSFLLEHATFVSHKLTFLLDATLGMINIEQSAIIKIVSVAAVFFLPPTLVASLYGMNFHHMPELDWSYGYPFAILIMVLSGVLPYKIFKYKGWL